ncbi:MAG: hypothetical protein ACFFDF_04010 [Candidatus Odinarchaeota archaeon]
MAAESKNLAPHTISLKEVHRNNRPLFNIGERILSLRRSQIYSLSRRSIPWNQMESLLRRAKFQPERRAVYIELINIIILNELLFKTFKMYSKKQSEE